MKQSDDYCARWPARLATVRNSPEVVDQRRRKEGEEVEAESRAERRRRESIARETTEMRIDLSVALDRKEARRGKGAGISAMARLSLERLVVYGAGIPRLADRLVQPTPSIGRLDSARGQRVSAAPPTGMSAPSRTFGQTEGT